MTPVEQAEFNTLSAEQKEVYLLQQKKHPTWSHLMLMTRVELGLMTTVEQSEFNKLNAEQKEEYLHQQKKHPNWDHQKLMTKVGFTEKVDQMIDERGDVDPNDKDIMKEIIEGVSGWLQRTLPRIWNGVKNLFSRILDGIINGVINFFDDLLGWIF